MNAIVPLSHASGGALIPTNMEGAMRLAEMMSRGKLVPQHLRDSPGDCLMVVEQSMRWGMSPFAVAQCTSVIQGKLMFEGKLVAAALHSSGIMSSRLEYEFSGEGDTRAIVVRGTLRGETTPREFPLTLKEAKTSNGMWTRQPDQQLVYAATRGWARRHASEVMLGVYSPEEFEPNERPADTFSGTTINATPEPVDRSQETARAIGDDLPDHAKGVAPEAPKRKTWAELLHDIERDFVAAQTRDAVDAVLASDTVQKALDKATNGTKERLDAIIKTALDRTSAPPIDNDPLNQPVDDAVTSLVTEDMIARIGGVKSLADLKRMKDRTNPAWRQEYDSLEAGDRAAVDRALDRAIAGQEGR